MSEILNSLENLNFDRVISIMALFWAVIAFIYASREESTRKRIAVNFGITMMIVVLLLFIKIEFFNAHEINVSQDLKEQNSVVSDSIGPAVNSGQDSKLDSALRDDSPPNNPSAGNVDGSVHYEENLNSDLALSVVAAPESTTPQDDGYDCEIINIDYPTYSTESRPVVRVTVKNTGTKKWMPHKPGVPFVSLAVEPKGESVIYGAFYEYGEGTLEPGQTGIFQTDVLYLGASEGAPPTTTTYDIYMKHFFSDDDKNGIEFGPRESIVIDFSQVQD